MLTSRDALPLENQRFAMTNATSSSRQNNKSQGPDSVLHNNNVPQPSNLVQGTGQLSVSNVPNTVQNSSVYNCFYSSPTFNSINNFEASLQWLTENRMPSNSLLSDKNLNCNSHSTPSHSCCVNRLATVDNIGMCSPLSGDSYRSSRETVSYQTKPPALSVNVIDSVQNWFNLPPLPNQQYSSSKFNDQNFNCSQINFGVDQASEKQNDICLQIPDSYFEQSLSSSNNCNKQMNGHIDINSKILDVSDVPSNVKGHNGYQANLMSREWKQQLQGPNYLSSPTIYGSLADSPDHYLYSIPPPVSTSSYCMVTDNIGNMSGGKMQPLSNGVQHNLEKYNSVNSPRTLQCMEQNNQSKINNQPPLLVQNQPNDRNDKSVYERTLLLNRINENCAHNIKNNNSGESNSMNGKYNPEMHYSARYINESSNCNNLLNNSSERLERKLSDVPKDNRSNRVEINDEITSGSEESNIIVEESDETEEIDSVISIDEMKKTFMSEDSVELLCLVCNVKSSLETPATHFIHINDSFPLTSASKMPVVTKLIQILPTDLQHFLKLHNSFMCRRCLNLIETVEVLEVKLLSVKQTLSENFSKTVQYFLPATPILEIENGKAKIIDKEIIPCLEKSVDIESHFTDTANLGNSNTQKTNPDNHVIELEIEESEDEVYSKHLDEGEEEEEDDDDDDDEERFYEDSENYKESGDEENCREGKKCNICSKVLSSLKNYKKHMELHTKCFSFYCEYCGKGFNLKNSLEKHLRLHSEDNKYQCDKCGKTYTQKYRLDYHLKKHLGEFKMNCSECGKGFMENASLNVHMRSHTKEKPFVCEICGLKFVKESNLKSHIKVCKKEEVKCNQCSEVFYSITHLKKHELTNHGAKPSIECDVCGKAFVNVKDLKPHMRSHSQDKPFECKICGKRYKSVGNLNHHSKIHDINKLFNCTLCGESFQRKKLFENHMNKHSGNRAYKCSDCGKSFYGQKNLQNHMKFHSGTIKLKTCQVCGKKFRQGLQAHMRTHTGIKPYACNHCGQAFTVNSTLTRHIQSKHPNALES